MLNIPAEFADSKEKIDEQVQKDYREWAWLFHLKKERYRIEYVAQYGEPPPIPDDFVPEAK